MHIYMELQGFQTGLSNRGAIQGEDHRNVLTDPSLRQCPGFLRSMQRWWRCNAFFAFSVKQVFVDQIFRIFDKDGNGCIDFKVWEIDVTIKKERNHKKKWLWGYITLLSFLKEFMLATDMTASGSPEEKLRWAFKMYDKVDQRTWWWGWW